MNLFDELAKSAAGGLSRRQALGRLCGLFGASLLGAVGLGSKVWATSTASDCADWCQQFPGPQRAGCENACKACDDPNKMCGTSLSTLVCCQGTCCDGTCTDTNVDVNNCGACRHSCSYGNAQSCCGGVCVDLTSDTANCGACGNVCPSGQICTATHTAPGGHCFCAPGTVLCGTMCVDPNSDNANCGSCGNACRGSQTCNGGTCVDKCPPGHTTCGDVCVNLNSDNANCGSCGNVCSPGTHCGGGKCLGSTSPPTSPPPGPSAP